MKGLSEGRSGLLIAGLFCLLFLPSATGISAPKSETGLAVPASGAARVYPETEFVTGGRPAAVIVFSGTDTATADAAKQLGVKLKTRLGVDFPAVADTALCPNVMTRVPDEYRNQNLIVVGNLHTNRVVFPLYTVFLCGTDCEFPGDAGYELRTISNPWGTGKNVLLIGGSTPEGLQAGAAAFLAALPAAPAADVIVPRLHEIKPGKGIQVKLDAISARYARMHPFKCPAQPYSYVSNLFTTPAFYYHWTGDVRWAALAREAMNYFNDIYDGYYPLGHYDAEEFFRAWDLVEEAPVFSDAERQVTCRRLLETSYGIWHIAGTGGAGYLGNTHGIMMNMTQWTATRYFQCTFHDDPALLKALAGRETALRDYYQAAVTGFLDDGNGVHGLETALRWSAMEQDPTFLESGLARQGLLYIATYFDPLGVRAGIGMYGEMRPGAMRTPGGGYWCEAYLFRLAAFLYQDPELAQLADRFAKYGPVDLWAVMNLSQFGAGTYPIPPQVKPKPPVLAEGLSIVPFDQRRYDLWNTGMPTRGVPANQRMPVFRRMFDKICFRTGYDAQDQYLLLQGLLFDSMDANTISRYTDRGEIWLTHNSSQIGPFVRNSMFISDGLNDRQVQSGCRLDAAGRFADFSMAGSTLLDYSESDWQRAIFWKPKAWFVVMDRAVLSKAGRYAGQSIWRMPPVPGTWNARDRRLTVFQGGKRFCIQAGEDLPARAGFEPPDSGPPDIYENPFILREYKSGFYPARRVLDFQNLLTVTDVSDTAYHTITRLNNSAGLVREPAGKTWLVGVGGSGTGALGLEAEGGMYAATAEEIYLAEVRMLRLDGELILDAPRPVSARIDLKTGLVTGGYDQAQLREAASTWKLKPPSIPVASWPKDKTARVAATLTEKLATAETAVPARPAAGADSRTASRGPGQEKRASAVMTLQWESADTWFVGKPPADLAVVRADNATGEPSELVDGIVPRLAGGMIWNGPGASVELAWSRPEPIKEIRIYDGWASPRNRPELAQCKPADRAIRLEWSSDGFNSDVRQETRIVDKEFRVDPTYKNEVQAHQWWRVPCDGVSASRVRLTVNPSNTGPVYNMTIGEIEVWTADRGPLAVDHLVVSELDRKGEKNIILSTAEPRLVVLTSGGKLRWQKAFTGRIPSIVVADIQGDGNREIVCCSYDKNVYAFSADGKQLWRAPFTDESSVPFAVGFWEPRPGLRRIAAGQYAGKSVLLDEQGKVAGHTGMAGYFARRYFGQADLNGDGILDLCLASIRYVGSGTIYVHIVDAEGRPVPKASGTEIVGGAPFAADLLKDKPGHAAIIAPGGVGVYNLNVAEGKYGGFNALWETGNRPLSAGLIHDIDGDGTAELLAGGRDGFVTIYSTDGIPLRVVLVGDEVTGVVAFGADAALRYVVATPGGLRTYDADWKLLDQHPGAYRSMEIFDPVRQSFLAVTDDARVQRWELKR